MYKIIRYKKIRKYYKLRNKNIQFQLLCQQNIIGLQNKTKKVWRDTK